MAKIEYALGDISKFLVSIFLQKLVSKLPKYTNMSASLTTGDVHPRISPGDRGLACGTVMDKNPCFSFSSRDAVCKEATNCIVLTKTILG